MAFIDGLLQVETVGTCCARFRPLCNQLSDLNAARSSAENSAGWAPTILWTGAFYFEGEEEARLVARLELADDLPAVAGDRVQLHWGTFSFSIPCSFESVMTANGLAPLGRL
jgi:hypothetical protein